MSWATSFFGETVVTKDGQKPTASVVAGKKRIGLYFSAHWCPPCRKFTPMLVDFYNRAQAAEADGIEILFVSADSDQSSFDGYYGEMPWAATVYGADCNEELNNKFDINGIPTFIVLSAEDGSVLDKEARGTVSTKGADVAACFAKWSK